MKTKLKFLSCFVITAVSVLLPHIVDAANWNDPGVNPAQNANGRWYNTANGQFVGTAGMTAANTGTGNAVPTNTGAENAGTGNTGTGNGANSAASTKKITAEKAGKIAGKTAGAAMGGYMIYNATKGKEKHNVGTLVEGVVGGAVGGVAWGGWGAVIGAVVGGAVAGSQLFSETDCLNDPVTQKFTCCNTAFNKGERQANIGDYMFCTEEQDGDTVLIMPGVRQCLQGGSDKKDTWWNGLWKDDAWSKCTQRYCEGEVEFDAGIADYIQPIADVGNICWRWECVEGYTRSGTTCIEDATGQPVQPSITGDPYEATIQRINQLRQQIIDECGNNI